MAGTMRIEAGLMRRLGSIAARHGAGGVWLFRKSDESWRQIACRRSESGGTGGLALSFPVDDDVDLLVELEGADAPTDGKVRKEMLEIMPELRTCLHEN